jgi:hypothetical protein
MSATTMMLIAWGALILGHWANNEPSVDVKQIAEMVAAILLITFLSENAQLEPIAKGLALLFLVAVLLGPKSIITGLSKIGSAKAPTPAPKKKAKT